MEQTANLVAHNTTFDVNTFKAFCTATKDIMNNAAKRKGASSSDNYASVFQTAPEPSNFEGEDYEPVQ